MEHFTVGDAYLVTVLNWAQHSGVDLAEWPSVDAYYKRTAHRPQVAKALAEEVALYLEEQARRHANAA
jgi:glutathione S-transferase